MGYILVDPQVLRNKGLDYFETLPDGRAIADFGVLKVLGDVKELEVVSSAESVMSLINEQKASGLYDQPAEEEPVPGIGDVVPGNGETVPEGEGFVPEGVEVVPEGEQPAGDDSSVNNESVKADANTNKEGEKA